MSSETPRRLIVNWQSETTREFLPVAELVVTKAAEGERFEFGYLEGVRARAVLDSRAPSAVIR